MFLTAIALQGFPHTLVMSLFKKLLSQSGENALDKTLYNVFFEWDTYSRNAKLVYHPKLISLVYHIGLSG